MNMISSIVEKNQENYVMKTDDGLIIPVPELKQNIVKEGQKISFGFRAEDIVPLKFGNEPSQSWGYKSKVNLSEPLGTETLIFTNFGKIEIVSRMFTPELVRAGDELDFALNLDRTYLFDDETGKAL
jgi:multiple sugar transport system ATP-binding protein